MIIALFFQDTHKGGFIDIVITVADHGFEITQPIRDLHALF
jgi:hypothetical protein